MTRVPWVLLYDADCGPCTSFKRAVDFMDADGRLDFLSIKQGEELGLLAAVPHARRHGSFHLVSPDRRVLSGAEALPGLIGLLPAGKLLSKLITLAPGGLAFLGLAYSTASRLHEVGSCGISSTGGASSDPEAGPVGPAMR